MLRRLKKFLEAVDKPWDQSNKLDRELYGQAHLKVQSKGVYVSLKQSCYRSLVNSIVDTNAEKLVEYA